MLEHNGLAACRRPPSGEVDWSTLGPHPARVSTPEVPAQPRPAVMALRLQCGRDPRRLAAQRASRGAEQFRTMPDRSAAPTTIKRSPSDGVTKPAKERSRLRICNQTEMAASGEVFLCIRKPSTQPLRELDTHGT